MNPRLVCPHAAKPLVVIAAICALAGMPIVISAREGDSSETAEIRRPKCGVTLTIAEQRLEPLIKKGDPGMDGNEHGLEGGCVLKQGSTYHLFTSEEIGEPRAVKMKIGHWTREDRLNWT